MNKVSFLFLSISFLLSDQPFKLMSFNIQGFNSKKNFLKVSKIIDEVKEFDILSLQENWFFNDFLIRKIKNFNFILDDSRNIFNSTGLSIILNKSIDVVEYEIINFSNCHGFFFNGSDCLASKGFIFARINLSNEIIDLYNTHLDSGNSKKDILIREMQLNELKNYIKSKKISYPLIVVGDFNIDYNSNEQNVIKNFMNYFNLELIEWEEEYFLKNKVDYIFSNKVKSHYKWSINNNLYNISDHPPMPSIIELK